MFNGNSAELTKFGFENRVTYLTISAVGFEVFALEAG
jgi:hypothetical protein